MANLDRGVGGRVAVWEGVNVIVTVAVVAMAGLLLAMGVFPLADFRVLQELGSLYKKAPDC